MSRTLLLKKITNRFPRSHAYFKKAPMTKLNTPEVNNYFTDKSTNCIKSLCLSKIPFSPYQDFLTDCLLAVPVIIALNWEEMLMTKTLTVRRNHLAHGQDFNNEAGHEKSNHKPILRTNKVVKICNSLSQYYCPTFIHSAWASTSEKIG